MSFPTALRPLHTYISTLVHGTALVIGRYESRCGSTSKSQIADLAAPAASAEAIAPTPAASVAAASDLPLDEQLDKLEQPATIASADPVMTAPGDVGAPVILAAAAAKNAQAMAESEKNTKDMLASVQAVSGITPKIMRSAHVVKLAEAKGCDFVAGERPPGS